MSESNQNKSLRPGQAIMCNLLEKEPGGYRGVILSYDIDAFVPSRDQLALGSSVPTTFVCMHNNRALVTFAYVVGTTERVQFGLKNEDETPFTIWADSYPSNVKLRRAVDLIMPSITGPLAYSLTAKDCDVPQLIADIEAAGLTGCIKATSEEALSRSAVLLYKGRAVGCIYGSKNLPEAHLFDKALKRMFNDIKNDDAQILVYELPEEIVLSMASLFIGCPVHEEESADKEAVEFINETLSELEEDGETACFTLTSDEKTSRGLGFLCRGKRSGSFSILEQIFDTSFEQLFKLAENEEAIQGNAYLLPREMISDSVLLGYSMSSYCSPGEAE
ncbi:MAG TPA: hypothetical protein PKD05_12835 [Candidatus Melainabacteria bacterium]|nr:hypothetical protein [Candidatus Melainabacteria bacterium]